MTYYRKRGAIYYSRTAFGKCPAPEFHDAVDFLDVDLVAIAEAQAAPGSTHAAGRFGLMELFDLCSKSFINGTGSALPGLVIGDRSGRIEPAAEALDRSVDARREEVLLDLAHYD